MSYDIIRSMSRIIKTDDGKFTVEVTASSNNVFPHYWEKCKFQPYDSKVELEASILKGIWGGMLHFQCKSKYQTFMDEVRYDICTSPTMKEIYRLCKWKEYLWNISSRNGHWNEPNSNPDMKAKCGELMTRLERRINALWIPLAREFAHWKPNKDICTIRIDGERITSFTHNRKTYLNSWRYVPSWSVVPSKVFTALEAAKIKSYLPNRVTIEPVTSKENTNKVA